MGFERRPLEEIVEDILDRRGVTPTKLGGEFVSSGHRVISAKLIKGGRIVLDADEPRFVNSKMYARWMKTPLKRGDVVMTSEAPLGELAYLDESVDWVLGQRLFAIRPRKEVVGGRFLYYALASPEVRDAIFSRASGSTVQGIRQAELRKVEVPVPPMSVQFEVESLLGSLDERIDTLRRSSSVCEAIAQALFKSWFVDFDPVRAKAEGREPEGMDAATANLFSSELEDSELGGVPWGWKVQSLGSVAGNLREQAKPELLDPDTPYVGLEHMPRKSIALMDRGDAEGLASGKFWYSPCDILFGRLRPYFHKVGVAAEKGICSTDILVVRPHQPEWFGYCVGQFSSDALIAYATQVSNGARMPRVGWKDLAAYKVVTPPHDVAAAFDRLVRPMITRIHQNIEHARTLANVRDTLLPRLISGKLRLPNAEHEIEAATA